MTPAQRKALQESGQAQVLEALQALRAAVMELAARPVVVQAPEVPTPVANVHVASAPAAVDLGPVIDAITQLADEIRTAGPPVVQVPPPPVPESATPPAVPDRLRLDPADLDALVKALAAVKPAVEEQPRTVVRGGVRNGLHVRDFYREREICDPVAGVDTRKILLQRESALLLVRPVGGDAWIDPAGRDEPSVGSGLLIPKDEPAYLPFATDRLWVHAPAGSTVHVTAFGYHSLVV